MSRLISYEALATLDETIDRALESGDHSALHVLGYGEISAVVAASGTRGQVACKRLPLFSDRERMHAYERVFDAYLHALEDADVRAVESRLYSVDRHDGRAALYCVQPMVDPRCLATNWLREADPIAARALLERLVETIIDAVTPRLGLDAQLSNWVMVDGALRYIDVTTPMMRSPQGEELVDTTLFLTSLPWALRPFVERFLLTGIFATYYDARTVIIDLAGNLIKERLDEHIPTVLSLANAHLPHPIAPEQVRHYYANDARTWAVLQRLRRADRWWQRRARRRPYPFLLPGRIER